MDVKQNYNTMNSLTFVILQDNIDIDVVAAELGAILLERFGIDHENIRCISLNEADIIKAVASNSVGYSGINVKESTANNVAVNPIYQALVFLRIKYSLNLRYRLDKFIENITNDVLSLVYRDKKNLMQDEKALLNAIKIIGEAKESDITEHIHAAKVHNVYIEPIKRVYKLL